MIAGQIARHEPRADNGTVFRPQRRWIGDRLGDVAENLQLLIAHRNVEVVEHCLRIGWNAEGFEDALDVGREGHRPYAAIRTRAASSNRRTSSTLVMSASPLRM